MSVIKRAAPLSFPHLEPEVIGPDITRDTQNLEGNLPNFAQRHPDLSSVSIITVA